MMMRGAAALAATLALLAALGTADSASATGETLDPAFSGDGIQTTDFGDLSFDYGADHGHGIAIQDDGKIVAVGSTGDGGIGERNHFAVARYKTDGTLDTNFSGDGRDTIDFAGRYEYASSVAIDSQDRIVVAGQAYIGTPGQATNQVALARYETDGDLDQTFSGDGRQTVGLYDLGGRGIGVAIQDDDKIVVAGAASVASCTGANDCVDFGLARLETDGDLDSTFSGNGRAVTDFPGADSNEGAVDVAIDSQDRIVAGGQYGFESPLEQDAAFARFDSDGDLDLGFSDDGMFVESGTPAVNAIAIDGTDQVVGIGTDFGDFSDVDFALARVTTGGALDPSFGQGGRLSIGFPGFSSWDEGYAVALQADGKIVAAGQTDEDQGGGLAFGVVRLTSSGQVDSAKVSTPFDSALAYDLAIDGDGKIVLAGTSHQTNTVFADKPDFTLVRYSSLGLPDTTPPETTITSAPQVETRRRSAWFEFTSDEPPSTFECRLDDDPFEACISPWRSNHLKRGRHKVRVRATDQSLNTDPTPDSHTWRVKR